MFPRPCNHGRFSPDRDSALRFSAIPCPVDNEELAENSGRAPPKTRSTPGGVAFGPVRVRSLAKISDHADIDSILTSRARDQSGKGDFHPLRQHLSRAFAPIPIRIFARSLRTNRADLVARARRQEKYRHIAWQVVRARVRVNELSRVHVCPRSTLWPDGRIGRLTFNLPLVISRRFIPVAPLARAIRESLLCLVDLSLSFSSYFFSLYHFGWGLIIVAEGVSTKNHSFLMCFAYNVRIYLL